MSFGKKRFIMNGGITWELLAVLFLLGFRIRSKRCCNYGYGVGGSNLGYGYGMGSYFYGHYGGGYNNNYGGTNIGSINTKNINA
ncbi:hypothetical protein Tcan_01861 [Toxocara canis]|uniref:Uncharacterized protein n=1 Tax=Toxocara canis TaxID=6265 RepID=A0A0B2V5H6_TOXCA|nr:hypothetical protein Tcan_01861 [Toxocara canis]